MSEEFIRELDRIYPLAGYDDRSKFIRDAIYEKLEREGFELPPGIRLAPSRAGKGGAIKYRIRPQRAEMNDAKSKPTIVVPGGDKAVTEMLKRTKGKKP